MDQDQMKVKEIQDYIRNVYSSRTIPTILGKILEIVRDDKSSPQDLYTIISHDQVLAERVIRMANSVFFGHSGNINGLPHAVMFLGYDRIRVIALAMGVMDVFSGKSYAEIKNLWIHGYEVAYISAAISDTISMASPDEVFVGGLIHDIGRVIFFEKDRELFYKIGTDDDMLQKEVELFGCTHADAGAMYAESVGIPENLIYAIKHHHHPSTTPDHRLLVSIVAIGEALSRTFRPRVIDDGFWTDEHNAIMLELSVGEGTKKSIREKLANLDNDINEFFK